MRMIVRADGSMDIVLTKLTIAEVEKELNCDCLDTVSFAHGMVMFVDDDGHAKGLPRNDEATALYWSRCGGPVDHFIVGDVYLCPDFDYA